MLAPAASLPRAAVVVLLFSSITCARGIAAAAGSSSLRQATRSAAATAASSAKDGPPPSAIAARASAAATRAENAAEASKLSLEMAGGGVAAGGAGSDAAVQVKQALQKVLGLRDEAKALLPAVEQQAYAAARAAAEAKVNQVSLEANEYFKTLMLEYQQATVPQADPKQEAVAQAAQPYYEAEETLKAMVENYNKQATDDLAAARKLVGNAQSLAKQAQYEQAKGNGMLAQQRMLEARHTIERANNKRGLAYRVRHLADSVNNAIPKYQQASDMAATYAFETFKG